MRTGLFCVLMPGDTARRLTVAMSKSSSRRRLNLLRCISSVMADAAVVLLLLIVGPNASDASEAEDCARPRILRENPFSEGRGESMLMSDMILLPCLLKFGGGGVRIELLLLVEILAETSVNDLRIKAVPVVSASAITMRMQSEIRAKASVIVVDVVVQVPTKIFLCRFGHCRQKIGRGCSSGSLRSVLCKVEVG